LFVLLINYGYDGRIKDYGRAGALVFTGEKRNANILLVEKVEGKSRDVDNKLDPKAYDWRTSIALICLRI
jgi:hypothetical protein